LISANPTTDDLPYRPMIQPIEQSDSKKTSNASDYDPF